MCVCVYIYKYVYVCVYENYSRSTSCAKILLVLKFWQQWSLYISSHPPPPPALPAFGISHSTCCSSTAVERCVCRFGSFQIFSRLAVPYLRRNYFPHELPGAFFYFLKIWWRPFQKILEFYFTSYFLAIALSQLSLKQFRSLFFRHECKFDITQLLRLKPFVENPQKCSISSQFLSKTESCPQCKGLLLNSNVLYHWNPWGKISYNRTLHFREYQTDELTTFYNKHPVGSALVQIILLWRCVVNFLNRWFSTHHICKDEMCCRVGVL